MELFTTEILYERYNIRQFKIKDFELFEIHNKLTHFINTVENKNLKKIYKQVRFSILSIIDKRLKEFEK